MKKRPVTPHQGISVNLRRPVWSLPRRGKASKCVLSPSFVLCNESLRGDMSAVVAGSPVRRWFIRPAVALAVISRPHPAGQFFQQLRPLADDQFPERMPYFWSSRPPSGPSMSGKRTSPRPGSSGNGWPGCLTTPTAPAGPTGLTRRVFHPPRAPGTRLGTAGVGPVRPGRPGRAARIRRRAVGHGRPL